MSLFERESLTEVAIVLAALVGLERRNDFTSCSPSGFEEKVKNFFGTETQEQVNFFLRDAQHRMCVADSVGKIYVGTINLAEINRSCHGDRVSLGNSTSSPFTFRELALDTVLRTLKGESRHLEPQEFLV